MNLGQIRQQFIKDSGRYDLVVDLSAYADNGANAIINAGIKYLDTLINLGPAKAKLFSSISEGSWYILFEKCRAIQSVWCSDTEDRWELTIVDLGDFKDEYPEPMANIDKGEPEYCAIAITRTSPKTDDQITIDSFGASATTESHDEETYKVLLIGPPADGDYEIEVNGLFYSTTLSSDDDENYWTTNWPFVVSWAACRQLEISYRNKEGEKDWTEAIRKELFGLECDLIEEEITNIDQIGG